MRWARVTSFSRPALVVLLSLVCAFCATSPLGRQQLRFFPEAEVERMGASAFEQLKEQAPYSKDVDTERYVRCVARAITNALTGAASQETWEVVVFENKAANAFALPGRKIGVYTGLLKVATNQAQLAAVLGHEVGHVLAKHANERMSTSYATNAGIQMAGILSGQPTATQRHIIGLLGAGAQLGIILPFSRTQESEADILGLDLMARAGFDPRESIQLWKNMSAAGDNQPAEILSTHPSHGRRIGDLERRMPEAIRLYEEARRAGRRPDCK